MATITLTDHQAIRDWAAARMAVPALVDISPEGGMQPMLRLVFDQVAYQDQDQPERPPNAGGFELVEWDEWLSLFDDKKLALVVNDATRETRDDYYELVRRDAAG